MKNIAILTGGDSEERVISLKSGQVVRDHLPKDRYRSFLIDIQKADWRELESGVQVDKNDFTLTLDGEKIRFDCAFAALHGAPLEDGKMQGYFEMLGIPYTCCDGYVSALTMNKHNTKMQLAQYGNVPMARSLLLQKGGQVDMEALKSLGLPLFVKPNTHGSSFGVGQLPREACYPRPAHDGAAEQLAGGRAGSERGRDAAAAPALCLAAPALHRHARARAAGLVGAGLGRA